MKKIFKNKTFLFTISALLWSLIIFAEDPGLPAEDPGTPAAPIDDWIPMIILIALVLAFYLLRKVKPVQQ